MIRITTPTITFKVPMYDLTETDVLVTIKQKDTVMTFAPDAVTYEDGKSTITCTLTQEQTQLLQLGLCKVQVNFTFTEDNELRRLATKVATVSVCEQLFEEVITA